MLIQPLQLTSEALCKLARAEYACYGKGNNGEAPSANVFSFQQEYKPL